MSEEFKPINTQEELNQVISQRLEQARSAERAKFADYDSIKTQLAGLQKDVTAKDTTIADLQGQLKTSRSDLVKTRIALEKGIPQELCSRLVGETEEEIRADADKLAGLMTKPKTAEGHGKRIQGRFEGCGAAVTAFRHQRLLRKGVGHGKYHHQRDGNLE